MGRGRLVLAVVVVWLCARAAGAAAQTVTPQDGWVVLPVDEYRTLRDRANPPPSPSPESTLTRVDYDLRVDGESIAGSVTLSVDVLRDGWTQVQLPPGLLARDATLNGQPVPLEQGPPPRLLLSRAGRSVVTLNVVMPLAASGGGESLAIPASPSPITRVQLSVPKSGVDVTLTGGFVAERGETATESRWIAYGRPNQALAIAWKRKADDHRAELPLRVRARITQVVGLGEESSQVTATVHVDVQQGLAREVALSLPADFTVNQVDGPTVADWDAADGMLRIKLLEPVSADSGERGSPRGPRDRGPAGGEVAFVVYAEAHLARDGSIAIPLVRMPSAEREGGGVAVEVLGAGEIRDRQMRGLEPADPAELGDGVARRGSSSRGDVGAEGISVSFRLRPTSGTEPRSLAVTVVRYTPQAVFVANVEEARYRVLASDEGPLLVDAVYAVRNNQRSFLKARLPPGSTVWSAEVAGRPVRPGVAEQDAVLLPLEKGRAGEQAPTFAVRLVYMQRIDAWSDRSTARLTLPALDLPASRTGVELHYSPRFRVDVQPGTFRVDRDPGPFAEALRQEASRPASSPTPAIGGAPRNQRPQDEATSAALQALVDRFKTEAGGRAVVGTFPVHIAFPSFGSSVFLAAELTAEGSAPAVDLIVKRVN
jgi:hypothetical protein